MHLKIGRTLEPMLEVQGKLVSTDLIEKNFVCNLQACKGACCVEGDEGAPLAEEEKSILDRIALQVAGLLDEASRSILEDHRYVQLERGSYATPLRGDGACIYSLRDGSGILSCAIETAYRLGKIDWIKPISCHLYPVRIREDKALGWEALNYDKWSICAPACANGDQLGVPVYRFVRDALIRKYGEGFYAELDEVAQHWKSETNSEK